MRREQVMPFAVNWLWLQSSRVEYRHLVNCLGSPEKTQAEYLTQLLERNAGTVYGRSSSFSEISSIADFQKRVPLTEYEDYLPYIEEIAQGKSGVLTSDPVILFQPTSGSSSASKLIPYTGSLKAEYQRAIAAWTCSLYRHIPGLMKGLAYWSISPSMGKETRGCIPVGFDDDSEYLGLLGKRLYSLVSVKPGRFTPQTSVDDLWEQTLVSLVATRNLTLISVWSPTFLLALARYFAENWRQVLQNMRKANLPAASSRARKVQETIEQHGIDFAAIWPNLKLISCWTDSASEVYVPEVRRYFPGVEIQGKGLIATEAFVSLPFAAGKDPILAVNSHFFEFRDRDTGDIYLVDKLREGDTYSLIVTTGGGLYRYQLHDLVKVTGRVGATPTLRFVSRDTVSDICGEKLNPEHVQRSAQTALAEHSLSPTFFLVAPSKLPADGVAYVLFVCAQEATRGQLRNAGNRLEALLRGNYHYAYCRQIGQLEHLKVFWIDGSRQAPEVVYLKEMNRRGQKLGDIKPARLDREFGWEERFRGQFLNDDNI